ncbi:MAG TPA: hypothetical protein VMC79_07615 [Rectinemataceae bacterium]|nr:hypothetical protein [Rectinemataceae bacterium]
MISLEQVHSLEERVERAVGLIAALRAENAALRGRVDEVTAVIDGAAAELEAAEAARGSAEARVVELERRVGEAESKAAELAARIEDYRRDQTKIEEGILKALDKLDSFEDLLVEGVPPTEGASSSKAEESAPHAPPARASAKPRPESGPGEAAVDRPASDSELDIF